MELIIGILLGVISVIYFDRVRRRFQKLSFTLFGFQVDISRPSTAETPVSPVVTSPLKVVSSSAACEFCRGEKEIRIAGTKDIIPCPKCNVQKNTG